MRIRSIRPEFYDSESMGNVSWDARFVFECLWSYVQDNGVNRDNARMIRGTCMPYDGDEVIPRIEAALDELEDAGCIVRYEWRGKHLLWLPNFLTYQKITNPSVCLFPTPDEADVREVSPDTREPLSDTHETLPDTARHCQTLATGVGVGVGDRSSSGKSANALSTRTRASNPTTDAYTPEFEAFWTAYPRKKDKRAAWKAWKAALKRADPEAIINAAKAEARRPCELKFRKYPASWLNADAWEDEPDQPGANMQPPGLSREQANLAHNMGVVQYFRDHPEG